jgi:hypothetical protein
MKRSSAPCWAVAYGVILMLLTLTVGTLAHAQSKAAIVYDGKWEVQANGDVKVTRQYKLPMQYYRMWKDADMHMLEFRSFSADRSAVEVADMDSKYDDMERTLTISMTVLGLAQNKGDHWEAKILAGEEFSNLDEAKKIAYFHFSTEGPMGLVQGQDRIMLSPDSTNPSWDPTSRAISYEMPEFSGAGSTGSPKLWWALCAVCMMGCAALWIASFVVKSSAEQG